MSQARADHPHSPAPRHSPRNFFVSHVDYFFLLHIFPECLHNNKGSFFKACCAAQCSLSHLAPIRMSYIMLSGMRTDDTSDNPKVLDLCTLSRCLRTTTAYAITCSASRLSALCATLIFLLWSSELELRHCFGAFAALTVCVMADEGHLRGQVSHTPLSNGKPDRVKSEPCHCAGLGSAQSIGGPSPIS